MWATELVYDTLTASRSLTCRWERLLCFLDAAVPLWQRKGIRKGTASFSTTSWQDGETWLRFNLSLRLFWVCLVYGKVKHQLLDFSQCKAILWFYFYFIFFCICVSGLCRFNHYGFSSLISPFIMGNLWDVTDRDMDRFSKALLESWFSAEPGTPLLHFMGPSRQVTYLKHLVGAAPIVYGLPVHLR